MNKACPMPCILCGPGLPPEITGESAGSTAQFVWLDYVLLRAASYTTDCSSSAYTTYKNIYFPIGISPYLFASCTLMNRWVRWVIKLLWYIRNGLALM